MVKAEAEVWGTCQAVRLGRKVGVGLVVQRLTEHRLQDVEDATVPFPR